MASIIDELNEEQKLPALKTEGPVLVTAGAGSGKTRLLTHRIAHLVQDMNISPSNILAITFTNKAANEMKERLSKLLSFGVQGMWIFTFHSMCSRILRINGDRVGLDKNFSIYGDSEKERLIKRVLQNNPEFLKLEKNKLKPETVAWHISNAKNELLSPDEYALKIKRDIYANIIIKAYQDYQRELLIANAVDFDDMLCKTYELLLNNEDVKEF
ncbi:MAG: UvrD-helicase domain-containing protein, partial [Clostridia bacterium]|nr:UvrD-helicase domain-containing protein [Clostridia bacterium]